MIARSPAYMMFTLAHLVADKSVQEQDKESARQLFAKLISGEALSPDQEVEFLCCLLPPADQPPAENKANPKRMAYVGRKPGSKP